MSAAPSRPGLMGGLAPHQIEDVAVVGKADEARDELSLDVLVDLRHAADQVLHHVFVGGAGVREVGVVQRVHLEVHRVAASVLEHARHGRRRRGRKIAIDEEAPCTPLLEAQTGAERAEPAFGGTGPVARPHRDQGSGDRLTSDWGRLDQRDAVLTGVADPCLQLVVGRGPAFHVHRAVVEDQECGQVRPGSALTAGPVDLPASGSGRGSPG